MRFFTIIAAAFAAVAVAQSPNPFTLDSGFTVEAGDRATLTWKPTTPGTVTLTLRSGSAKELDKGTVIQTGIPNTGSYAWNVPSFIASGSDYTIQISSDSDDTAINYSAFFSITGGSDSSSSSSGSSSSTSSGSSTTTGTHSFPTSYMPHNRSSTTTGRYASHTGKATITQKTVIAPTKTTTSAAGTSSAPSDAAALNHAAPMLALAIAGAVVAL